MADAIRISSEFGTLPASILPATPERRKAQDAPDAPRCSSFIAGDGNVDAPLSGRRLERAIAGALLNLKMNQGLRETRSMNTSRRWSEASLAAAVGLALLTAVGCQTWTSGMTLPSPHYLEHPPQYFPPSPAFPLARELASMEAAAAGQPAGAPPAGAPVIPALPER
jgi:hypothetical protein